METPQKTVFELIRDIYKSGLNDSEVFESMRYNMVQKTIFERELKKTHYLKDKTEQLKQVRALLSDKNDRPTMQELLETSTTDGGLFYNTWAYLSYVRELEIGNYIQSIFDKSQTHLQTSKYKAVCYLIDEQFKSHSGLLDSVKHDEIYNCEYNALVFEVLEHKVFEIAQIKPEPISETLQRNIKKSLYWNANVSHIGTLFGVLHKEGLISGSKVDVSRALSTMFNLKESTLLNCIKLHSNINDAKTYYDTETVRQVKEWVDYLKDSIPKTK